MDTTNDVEPVQLENHGTMTPNLQNGNLLVPLTKYSVPYILRGLLEEGEYEKVTTFFKASSDFLRQVCPLVASFDHFKGLFGYIKKKKIIPKFLMHGNMAFIRHLVTEIIDKKFEYYIKETFICGAIIFSLNQDMHKRAIDLLEALHGRCARRKERSSAVRRGDSFEFHVGRFLGRLAPEKEAHRSSASSLVAERNLAKNIRSSLKFFAKISVPSRPTPQAS